MVEDTRNPKAVSVLSKAKAYADAKYKEGTNNDTVFGKWYGMNNQPWCAMFVSKCFDEAGFVNLVAASTKKGFASCNAGWKWFVKNGQSVPVGQAEPGDIVFFNFDSDPTTTEHVGIVYTNDGKGTLTTFEGNTAGDNAGSQANGDGAYQKKRPYKYVMGVVRPKW
jgi:cell wall-associated NlpC family hydrolase